MKFESEKELVSLLKETIESTYMDMPIKIFNEVSLGFGIADLVVSNLDLSKNRPEELYCQLGTTEIHVFTLLENRKSLTLPEIIDITRINKYRLQVALNELENRGLVQCQSEKYFIIKEFELSFKLNYAVEAKLRDWKRALKQAYRYLWFADYSYVVMDDYYSGPALKQIDLFKQYNVGLASINSEGELKRYYNPKRQEPFDIKMQRLFSEKLKENLSVV